ncbi:MAG: hypothetical protein A3B07_00200 [Candidatus Yonathbacteria bacterium RIFCSPLOWO2_01_FULL_43_27]|uniref:ComEC/Rec2-related protein domain-containing protein n=2 Tax=Parcubacteria group TaxID=1794811 RepID=A0A1G2SEE2_9BACT|nr:MAG: internalization-related competence protein ComEC/Rec2 protein [Candidatus Azambacteria bacterium GW2011_GWA1_44_9]OHA78723.1 MAG: hypothetical protein A2658_01140 [Candidatus Yonathbacteria bacterium RIFCSPHIGHO2_01_FULL_44_19]OHA83178.1 MAG: hypothetical protein A3B07_00200 [Candidatus Yonathbacteria bacterium RIFCSPLOWO2_01_FULL_43_27]
MSSKYFFGFILGFILGVSIESIFNFGYSFTVLFLVLAFILILLVNVVSSHQRSFFVSFVLASCALGVLCVDVSSNIQNAHILDVFVGTSVRVGGMVVTQPDVREEYTNIVLEARDVFYGGAHDVLERPVHVLVRTQAHPKLYYGDELVLKGELAIPKNFAPKEGARAFDYRAYLAKEKNFYQMFFPEVTVVARGHGNFLYEKLFAMRAWLFENMFRAIPEPEASLAGGILLGEKQSLGSELLQKFRDVGVAHIVVLSGYNIAIVASGATRALVVLPFFLRVSMSVGTVILFALMVGGGATVVRATIMVLVVILARAMGREGSALRALALAGGVMIFLNPLILFHDVSFQLSFMATLALVVFAPVLNKYFLWIRQSMLQEIVTTTFATQIFVLPLILYQTGSLSLISFIANIFILPVIPLVMFFTALVALLSWVPFLGTILSSVAHILLSYIISVVSLFSHIPFATISKISFSFFELIISYIVITIVIVKNYLKTLPSENRE